MKLRASEQEEEEIVPFKSDKQRRFMFEKHPDIAKKWVEEAKGVTPLSLEERRKAARQEAISRRAKNKA